MMNYTEAAYDDAVTVESLQTEVEELTGKVSMLMHFVNQQFNACPCENCGHVHPRNHMLAVYGMDRGSDGKELPQSSRWFCGFCAHAAMTRAGLHQQECRDRIGKWLAVGYGRTFARNEAGPVVEFLLREFASEIKTAALRYAR